MIRVAVGKTLGAFALDIAFESDGGVIALFGPSGSGKSATIGLIAGLTRPDRGVIALDGRALVDTAAGTFVPPHARRIGLVFQDAQLFPHLSVKHNLLFGRWFAPKAERRIALEPVVDTLGIGHLLDRRPGRLSGGEKQRVAIGRALVSSPRLLLMDEPLAALDAERKQEILPLIERLRDEFGIPIVYVSHAVEEVARLAARVVVLAHGRVAAAGSVEDVFGGSVAQAGESRFRRASFVTARVAGHDETWGLTELAHSAGTIWLAGRAGPPGRDCRVVIRATDVTLATERPSGLSVRTVLHGTIARIEADAGPLASIVVDLDGHGHVLASATRKALDELRLAPGHPVFALIKTVALDEQSVALAPASAPA
ncbi:molybdenum ABC transporter ATP-binding protein [Rhodoplanes sp. TEM]|uniref:Molybdenum ABC transporter ATP-binding protein n=1 Tax=Rhodoplanes tepidamans TaxID=200616 RepID=A0ABT5JB38_RHOTP|nr:MULTISPECIES: molybdenum ABC transporter ATP-binding protein [Rhodoplanes]MDC7786606.1 molybdenum ABC transporter ATP-binding protein [Rhodoplanes tepidamans]MDC7983047.1 molybdenum ABC transporter ATP-binding protein [Rhodoplanes sp. TEM]MDQ0356429.1 molybdate transport system ATP-binding protein [Rhodoplanes tepidamans]